MEYMNAFIKTFRTLNQEKNILQRRLPLLDFRRQTNMWNKRSEEKIRSSFQNNTAQNTSVLGGEKGGGGREGKKSGKKEKKEAKPTVWVLGYLTLPTQTHQTFSSCPLCCSP